MFDQKLKKTPITVETAEAVLLIYRKMAQALETIRPEDPLARALVRAEAQRFRKLSQRWKAQRKDSENPDIKGVV